MISKAPNYLIIAFVIKLASIFFTEAVFISATLNYGSIIFLALGYLQRRHAMSRYKMMVYVLVASIFVLIGSIVHGVILGGDLHLILQLSKGFFITILFIPAASVLSRADFKNIAILVILLLTIKSALNVSFIILFIKGLISESFAMSFFGDFRQNFRFFDGEIAKIYEKGLIYIPLLLVLQPRFQIILLIALVPIVYLSFTVSFWISLVLTGSVFLNAISKKLFWLLFSIPIFFFAEKLLFIFQTEKMHSISVKMDQVKSFGTDFLVGGNGLGVTGLISYQKSDVFIENSLLNLGLWFGVMGLVLSMILVCLLFIASAYVLVPSVSNNYTRAYATLFISLTINSLSNPYLFSSSVLCALLLCGFAVTRGPKCLL